MLNPPVTLTQQMIKQLHKWIRHHEVESKDHLREAERLRKLLSKISKFGPRQ